MYLLRIENMFAILIVYLRIFYLFKTNKKAHFLTVATTRALRRQYFNLIGRFGVINRGDCSTHVGKRVFIWFVSLMISFFF